MEPSSNPQNPQISMNPSQPQWTFEENKIFEKALGEVDRTSPSLYQDIAHRIPWKSLDEIKEHYNSLMQDLDWIHSGHYPKPADEDDQEKKEDLEATVEGEASSRRKYTRKNNQKPVMWTEQEHQLFLIGLDQYGKGDWKGISRDFVRTKTPIQVASHGQKYFKRLSNPTPANKRRYSIHDISINPTLVPANESSQIPNFNPPSIEYQNPISNPDQLPPNPNTVEGFVDLPADDQNNTMSTTKDTGTSQSGEEFDFMDEQFIDNLWLNFDPSDFDLP